MHSRHETEPEYSNSAEDADRFPHVEVEVKWMNRWVSDGIYCAHNESPRPKYYVLDMFPYPSGVGLHLGHVEGYTASDIVSRYKRMNGYEVLHPMGWDAFGLPTENYAIKTGVDPHKVTADNANVFRAQSIRTGFSIDWQREIDTSQPEYYKWTQKIFLELYKNGLAYKAEAPVNWCGGCLTVIANEQVEDGHCERCNSPVEIRNIEQWFFSITRYADRLDQGLNEVDWPQSTKDAQSNWIGKTDGFEIPIEVQGSELSLKVFMTEPELLVQPALILMAPEHPDLQALVLHQHQGKVSEYVSTSLRLKERDRKKEKRMVVFTGRYGVNPLTGEKMPIMVSSSVLMDEFGGTTITPDKNTQRKGTVFESQESVLRQLAKKAKPDTRYRLRDWLVSRERYWGAPIPIIHCETCGDQPVPDDQLPVLLPHLSDYVPTGVPPLARSEEFLHTSCPNCGGKAEREAKTLDTFVDSSWYFLRYVDPRNNSQLADRELLRKWLPVDLYVGGREFATGHLLYSRFITHALHDLGYLDFTEPFKILEHQGIVIAADGRKMSKRWGNVISPETVADEYGSDVLRLHMMVMGPLDQQKRWDNRGILGSRRFVDRVWRTFNKVVDGKTSINEANELDKLVRGVTSDIESGKYNTAVSKFMSYLNNLDESENISRQSYETLLKLLAPFAPFVTEELWQRLGNKYSIHQAEWPKPAEIDGMNIIELTVMLNGRYVGTLRQSDVSISSEQAILAFLRTDKEFAAKFANAKPKKIIYKPGKVFNVLTL